MILTGHFSLITVEDGQGYEYAFRRTTNYAAPSITSYTGPGVPEGWTSSPQGTSAVYSYEWQVQRTKSGDTYGPWSVPSLYSRWTTDGAPGQKGGKGAKMRSRVWAAGQQCCQGTGDEPFYDVSLYNDKLYLCIRSHTASSSNNPQKSVSEHLGYWEIAQDWVFIATKLMLAEKIRADQIDADGMAAVDVDITGVINATKGSFKNLVMNYKIQNLKIDYGNSISGSWDYIAGYSSPVENMLATLSSGQDIGNAYFASGQAFVYRNGIWEVLKGLVVSGNVAKLNVDLSGGNIIVTGDIEQTYIKMPAVSEANYGTEIEIISADYPMSMSNMVRTVQIGDYLYSSNKNFLLAHGRIGGSCRLMSTPLGWRMTMKRGRVNETMVARVQVQYISSSKSYSVSAECAYNYVSYGSMFSAVRIGAGNVLVKIPLAIIHSYDADDIKVYPRSGTWGAGDNRYFDECPGKATIYTFYDYDEVYAAVRVCISDDESMNDGDFVLEVYNYLDKYIGRTF